MIEFSMADFNPLFDRSTDNQAFSTQQQAIVNTPVKGGTLPAEDQEFLKMLLDLTDKGVIKLYEPSSLINQEAYAKLTELEQGKVDQNAMNMLTKIRTIVEWERSSYDTNVQVEYMIQALRLDKERLEAKGNLFVI